MTVFFSTGIVLGSCRNHEVLQHAARFLSILGKLRTSVGDPDPHILGFPDPLVRGTDPDLSFFSQRC